jgi:hypothetical protein
MRRLVLAATAVGLVSAGLLVARDASAAPAPVVSSIVEGREGGTNKEVIVVVGNNLTSVNQFNLADTTGTLAGQLTVTLKTKNLLVFGLPDGLAAAHYTMRLFYGKNASNQIAFDIVVSNLAVPPAAVSAASLDPALRVDLNDADTLGGRTAAFFSDAGNLTGTISPARFSAYGDLVTELKIGTASSQVAAGDHDHDARYLLRAGDTVQNSAFVFNAATQTAVAATSGSPGAFGLSGTNTAASGIAVIGAATSTSGTPEGVKGTTGAVAGYGVHGESTAATGAGIGVYGTTQSTAGAGVSGVATASASNATAIGVDGSSASGLGYGVRGTCTGTSGAGVAGQSSASGGIGVFANSSSATGTGVLAISGGNGLQVNGGTTGASISAATTGVIVTTTAAASAANAIAIFQQNGTNKARIDTNGKGYFNGGTATSGADFAESVVTARPAKEYEPGDVIVIDVKGERRFALSSSPNSKLVAGVYATKPGVLARNGDVDGSASFTDTEIPMAIVGIVPCKVCDENGAIEAGDLLVSSSTPGHAMKAPDNPAPGTVVGKALAKLVKGSGKIEVLLIGR